MSRTNNIFAELIDRMGGTPDYERDSTPDDVFEAHCFIEDLAWRNAIYFVLTECFTDRASQKVLLKLKDIDYSALNRKERVRDVIKELFGE